MDAKELFLERYEGFQEYPVVLVKGMTERQQRVSPHPTVNPVAWLLWHTARCEDIGINRLLVDRRQVLDDGAWFDRLGVADRSMGTGMTRQEVQELSEKVNLSELGAYRTAVTERTFEVVKALPSAELDDTLGDTQLRRAIVGEGGGGRSADAIVEAYSGNTKGWLLGHLALTHQYYHIGQAFVVRGMHGLPNPW